MEVLGIIIGLIILMGLAYMGYSIIWVAPVAAGFVAWTGGLNLLDAYTGVYMSGLVGFLQTWFPVFMLSSIFGKLMEDTGMARSIALTLSKLLGEKRAILGVFISAAVLTYGGISLFVVVFAVYPLALSLFRQANLPRRLIPATIALGAFTFTMTALPGTPQIQNLIPMPYFFTTPTAAPIMGIAAALVMAVGGYFYLMWRQNQLINKGELFDEPKDNTVVEVSDEVPNVFLSLIPLLSVLITLNILEWNIVVSLLAGIILILLLSLPRIRHIGVTNSVNVGAKGSVTAILNTSAAVGFGTTVQAVPGFAILTSALMSIPGNPLVSLSVAINLLAGATGSASGGMGIALEALGEQYYNLSQTSGISPEAFHRVASISSGGLDVLPHNGAVLTLLTITGLSHKDSYVDIAVVAIVIPVLSVVVAIILASMGLY
ncbi:GntP family permease [Alkalibacterium sp. 20]|uniref:GntP family permease n=1 Tax=Alkalibacterium sp. 20 TaxID=1798803 RepID=UPI0009002291|nr:GntP family permease [Alkalibacterium sp. 20]OJF95956.1 transporter [Alkalibacterium sp. 20]